MAHVTEIVNGYTFVQLIGEGQYGRVYKATKDGQTYAVKKMIIIRDLVSSGVEQAALAKSDVECLRNIRHPFLVRYEGYFEDQTLWAYIVMDFCDCPNFKKRISEKRQSGETFLESDITRWISQLALALVCVHEKNIFHRELKPNNIFLTAQGHAKLGDFSMLKVLSPDASRALTRKRTAENYRAPEMWRGVSYTNKVDIWSLGCFLYELLTLSLPFACETGGQPALLERILFGNYEPVRVGAYSEEMKSLLRKLLTVDPKERPSALQVLNESILRETVKNICEMFKIDNPNECDEDMYIAEPEETGDEEFSPQIPDPSGKYPRVFWAASNPQSQSRLTWRAMVNGQGGTLSFPPMVLPHTIRPDFVVLLRLVRRKPEIKETATEAEDVSGTNEQSPVVPKKDMRLWIQAQDTQSTGIWPFVMFTVSITFPTKRAGLMHVFKKRNIRATVTKDIQILNCQHVFPWDSLDPELPPFAEVQITACTD